MGNDRDAIVTDRTNMQQEDVYQQHVDKSDINIEEYFHRRFKLQFKEGWNIPQAIFVSEKWSVPSMQEKKKKLNSVKELLSNFDLAEWRKYTKLRDASGLVVPSVKKVAKPEFVTIAWVKFYECLNQFEIIPKLALENGYFSSLHLCEAPGAFICALNHYLVTNYPTLQWKWLANTLNPDYQGNPVSESIPDDRFIRHTLDNWIYGPDFTGNIKSYSCHLEIVQQASNLGKVWLVTADGSIDCMKDPGEQESLVKHLHYYEVITALAALSAGGTFVMKIFTVFEGSTINFLYLLNMVFREVHVFKPATSKGGNSEVYLICLNFKGNTVINHLWDSLLELYRTPEILDKYCMFGLSEINTSFIEQLELCADYFMEKQIKTIQENVQHFNRGSDASDDEVYYIREAVQKYYLRVYKVQPIPSHKKIVQVTNFFQKSFYNRQLPWNDSWTYREDLFKLDISKNFSVDINNLLEVKYGRAIDCLYYSHFCSLQLINSYSKNFLVKILNSSILEKANGLAELLVGTTGVVDINKLTFNKIFDFHFALFFTLRTEINNDNLIFVKIPFLTSFAVQLLFLVMLQYQKVSFHKCGLIVLESKNVDRIKDVQNCLQNISLAYTNLLENKNTDGVYDIMQIMPLSVFVSSLFSKCIWAYNNALYS